VRVQSSDTNVTTIDLINIPDTAIDHNASPPVVLRLLDRIATQNGTPHAATTIKYEDPAMTFLLKKFTDQNIVFIDLQRYNRASKDLTPSVNLEDGLKSTKLAIHD
jgi:hypothetical protein